MFQAISYHMHSALLLLEFQVFYISIYSAWVFGGDVVQYICRTCWLYRSLPFETAADWDWQSVIENHYKTGSVLAFYWDFLMQRLNTIFFNNILFICLKSIIDHLQDYLACELVSNTRHDLQSPLAIITCLPRIRDNFEWDPQLSSFFRFHSLFICLFCFSLSKVYRKWIGGLT